jgi:5-methylcytosine-specific restriction endonuclease McrA
MPRHEKFAGVADFAEHLRVLHKLRHDGKLTAKRRLLSPRQRRVVFQKTGGKCHICGGPIGQHEAWQADHVFSHSLGGQHSVDNYLPAHSTCNNYRWFYLSEEFQWILKLGVWLKTQIKNETYPGRIAAEAFLVHERGRVARRKTGQPAMR